MERVKEQEEWRGRVGFCSSTLFGCEELFPYQLAHLSPGDRQKSCSSGA